jgi:hypothetical protein
MSGVHDCSTDPLEALLQAARQEHALGERPKALESVRQVLAAAPSYAPALLLAAEITSDLESSRLHEAIQKALYKGEFRQAELKLSAALAEQVHPERFKDLQRLLQKLKIAYRAANIYPIRELIRNGQFKEALQQIDIELRKNLSGDLEAELLGLEADIYRQWPEQALAWTVGQLHAAKSDIDFALIEEALTVVLGTLGTFPQRAHAERLRRQAMIGRLHARLDLIELALDHRLAPVAGTPSYTTLPLRVLWQLDEAPPTLEAARQWAIELLERAQAQNPPLSGVAERTRWLTARIGLLLLKR